MARPISSWAVVRDVTPSRVSADILPANRVDSVSVGTGCMLSRNAATFAVVREVGSPCASVRSSRFSNRNRALIRFSSV